MPPCSGTDPCACCSWRIRDGIGGPASAALRLQSARPRRMASPRDGSRSAGVLIPLFSFPSGRGGGIGEIGDIAAIARWLEAGGQRILQLLPINEMPPGESSPYSALSAMAIDPQFIALDHVEDFAEVG